MSELPAPALRLSGGSLRPEESGRIAAAAGGVIVYPTDTFYGLGTRPASGAGLRRIYRLKGRSLSQPLLLLIDAARRVEEFAALVTDRHRRLMDGFWPGPLTLLFPARPGLAAEIAPPGGQVALRLPGDPLCRRIVAAAGGVLTGTSANRSGEGPSRSVAGIASAVTAGADLVIDAGTLPAAEVSTVLSLAGGEVEILREGAVKVREIEDFLRGKGGDAGT